MTYTLGDLKRLVRFASPDEDVLSLYVDTSLEHQTKPVVHAEVLEQLKVVKRWSKPAAFEQAKAFVRDQLHFEAQGQAFFFSPALRLKTAFDLPRSVKTQAWMGAHAVIRPLVAALDEYERFAVALVTRKHTRLFMVSLGEIEERGQVHAEGFIPHQGGGGSSQERFQQRRNEHDKHYYRVVGKVLAELRKKHVFHRVIVVGTPAVRSAITSALPAALKRLVVADTGLETFRAPELLLKYILKIEARLEAEGEVQLLKSFSQMHHQKGRTVDTAKGVADLVASGKKVELLLVSSTFRQHDLVEMLIRSVLLSGGHVDFLEHTDGLAEHGDIAAVIRNVERH